MQGGEKRQFNGQGSPFERFSVGYELNEEYV